MNVTKVAKLDEVERFNHQYEGVDFWFDALKNSFTPDLYKNWYNDIPAAVISVVKAWDVAKDDKGTVWPLTYKEVAKLPYPFLNSILDKLAESWRGNEQPPSDSASS